MNNTIQSPQEASSAEIITGSNFRENEAAPKADVPKADSPKTDASKTDVPKTDVLKTDVPKTTTPKTAEEALSAGSTLHIAPEGISMLPLIRPGRDTVYIKAAELGAVNAGDIVLIRDNYKRLVLHRICKKTPTAFYTVGDNHLISEGPFTDAHLLGRMIGMERGSKYIDSRQTSMRLYGKLWLLRRRILLIIRAVVKGKFNS